MKILKLELQDFRGIRAASIVFGPGLNVLHGPNELGKSTLAEAVRAALLVPVRTNEAKSYVSWNSSAPALVTLTFESGDKLWIVRKTFGSPPRSTLECSDTLDEPRFREVASGREVEGKLRDLLRWGIAAPAERGAPKKPTSYLVTALLGRQGEVQGILDASLAEDTTDTGKSLVTNALGVLGNDPLVVRVVERLSERVDEIFTPGQKFKRTADSPLVKLQEHLKTQEDRLRELRDADIKGKAIEQDVISLQSERVHILTEKQLAEGNRSAAKEHEERATKRAGLQEAIDGYRNELDRADQLISELDLLQTRLTAEAANQELLKTAKETAASMLEDTVREMQAASEEVVRANATRAQSAQLAEAAHQQRRAEVDGKKAAADARLKDIESAEKAESDMSALETDLQHATASHEAAAASIEHAKRSHELATLDAKLQDLTERQETSDRLSTNYEDAKRRAEEASRQLSLAETALSDAVSRRDRGEIESFAPEVAQLETDLRILRAVELRIRIRFLRDEVNELEAHNARANDCRGRALARRSTASQLEQEIANRSLPTKEQVESWRALQTEIGGEAPPVVPVRPSALAPVAAGIAAGLAGALAVRFPMASSATAAIVSGIAIAVLVTVVTWRFAAARVRSVAELHERGRRLSERWTLEVLPSLRASGLPGLDAYESALADMGGRRAEAQRLRLEAEEEDIRAAAAAQAAAPLESRRVDLTRLESEEPIVDGPDLAARLEEFRDNHSALRLHISDRQQRLDQLRLGLRQAAEEAVQDARAGVIELQSAHDVLMQDTATAKAEFDLARQRSDPDTVDQTRARIEDLERLGVVALSVDAATSQLEKAQHNAAEASAKLALLSAQLDAMRPKVMQLVSTFGESLSAARAKVEVELLEIETQLKDLEQRLGEANPLSIPDVLTSATAKRAELESRVGVCRNVSETATMALSTADETIATLKTEVASKYGELNATSRDDIGAKLQAALNDDAFQPFSESDVIELGAASAALETVKRRLEDCDGRLNAAKGQLHLIAGHVGSDRLAQQEEAVSYARDEVLNREKDERAALRLLNEIRSVEATRTAHLGRALAGPVTETFRELTEGRYGQIGLDSELRTRDVSTLGSVREVTDLSVGTREQLATLIRLAVAAHLQTAIILDDQLVHSDSGRLAWFCQRLRSSVRDYGHQIIVFTCRPNDYTSTSAQAIDDSVSVIDLAKQLSR